MCENKHTKARKYRQKQIAGAKIYSNQQKKMAYIYCIHEHFSLPMHLLQTTFYVNCAKKKTNPSNIIIKLEFGAFLFFLLSIPVTSRKLLPVVLAAPV